MSTKFKTFLSLFCLLASCSIINAQTVELVTGNFVGTPQFGPTISSIGAAAMRRDNPESNNFSNPTVAQACNVTFSLANQQYAFSGAPNTIPAYSNISTGLVFGASPTTATGGVTQGVDPLDTYRLLGSYSQTPGGPTDNMFTAKHNGVAGTGIDADGIFSPPANDASGSVVVFTAAQALFDQPGGPVTHNSSTRYYFGDLRITLSRFVDNPVIHIAGLGGSYRYFPTTGTNINDPSQWRSTFFSTELEVLGFPITKLSGNTNFNVVGNNIYNSAAVPNGASVPTVGGLFQEFGAASGSFSINGPVRVITVRVYLRGCTTSEFPWSTVAANVASSTRNPFTGDIWSVSVSAAIDQLIPLPATGMSLNAALSGNDVQLSWKTLSEINTNQFEIERSSDGVNFSVIGTKAAAGSSAVETSYAHTDANMQVPVYYYRLKLYDNDGSYKYSNIAVVRRAGSVKGVKVFPNPAFSQLNVEFSNAKGDYVISLHNMTGQEVSSQKAIVQYNVQYINVNRNNLPAGSYIMKVRNTGNGEVYNEKIILQ